MACREYRLKQPVHFYGTPFVLNAPGVWLELYCATRPNGTDFDLSGVFTGREEDAPAFYEVMQSATPER
jgi:hypothetical protein